MSTNNDAENSRGGKRPGSGRRRGPKRVVLKARVLPETIRHIDQLAFDRLQTRGEVIDSKFPKKKQ